MVGFLATLLATMAGVSFSYDTQYVQFENWRKRGGGQAGLLQHYICSNLLWALANKHKAWYGKSASRGMELYPFPLQPDDTMAARQTSKRAKVERYEVK